MRLCRLARRLIRATTIKRKRKSRACTSPARTPLASAQAQLLWTPSTAKKTPKGTWMIMGAQRRHQRGGTANNNSSNTRTHTHTGREGGAARQYGRHLRSGREDKTMRRVCSGGRGVRRAGGALRAVPGQQQQKSSRKLQLACTHTCKDNGNVRQDYRTHAHATAKITWNEGTLHVPRRRTCCN